MSDLVLKAQASGEIAGVVLHANSPRPTQTLAIGGYLMTATLSRSWPDAKVVADNGAMLVIQSAPNEFYITGSGLTVTFARDPDVDNKVSGISSIEDVSRKDGTWTTLRRLNGDQSNQGRQLAMSPNQIRIYRVVLYSAERAHPQEPTR